MASHVVVIASNAKRATVKVTPSTHLSDVLQEACQKLGVNASQHGLKNNKKDVDLSRTIRLSGLSSGAKLELVQLSKSAGVVSVALQLPQSEAGGLPSARLTDKFPSTTTLWLILRKFEAGVAGGDSSQRNLTARGIPSTNTGAGRMFYETPVIQVMGRTLTSFTDLQKTLAQLGCNGGTILLRLTFSPTQTPLEEAMAEIESYFHSVDGSSKELAGAKAEEQSISTGAALEGQPESSTSMMESSSSAPQEPGLPSDSRAMEEEEETTQRPTTSSGRPLSIYRPPSNTVPVAAQTTHNPADYTPTVEHAQIHQRMLNKSTLNKRLPTEKEIEEAALAEQERLASIKDVEIKIRMPDQAALAGKFTQADSGFALYAFVRECLDPRWRAEPFLLRHLGVSKHESNNKEKSVVPDDAAKMLIKDLGLKGRVLLVFGWDEDRGASVQARMEKNIIREDLRRLAEDVKVQDVSGLSRVEDEADPGKVIDLGRKDDGAGGGEKKKSGGVPKWLKGLSKK